MSGTPDDSYVTLSEAREVAAEPSAEDRLIGNLAALIAGLAVPVSMPGSATRLGKARDAWSAVHGQLAGIGWHTAEDYERALRRVLHLPGMP